MLSPSASKVVKFQKLTFLQVNKAVGDLGDLGPSKGGDVESLLLKIFSFGLKGFAFNDKSGDVDCGGLSAKEIQTITCVQECIVD